MFHTWKNHSQYPPAGTSLLGGESVTGFRTLSEIIPPSGRRDEFSWKSDGKKTSYTDSDPPGRSAPWTYRNSISRVKGARIEHVVWHETPQRGGQLSRVYANGRDQPLLCGFPRKTSYENPHAARIVTCFFCRARVRATETNLGVRKFSQKSRPTRPSQQSVPPIVFPPFSYTCFDFLSSRLRAFPDFRWKVKTSNNRVRKHYVFFIFAWLMFYCD